VACATRARPSRKERRAIARVLETADPKPVVRELIGLRWEDVDLVAGRITVRQNVVDGKIGTPKPGKPREIPLGIEVRTALKAHRHLRGPLVFCDMNGKLLGTVDAAAVACVQEGWPSPDRLPRASPLVRFTPRDARRFAQGRAGAARALVDPDDDALRAETRNSRLTDPNRGGDKGDRILPEHLR